VIASQVECYHHQIETNVGYKDPREALILSLKRAVVALQEENIHLRHVIDMEKSIQKQQAQQVPDAAVEASGELMEMPPAEVQNLLDNLLQENRALRKENADLYALREALLRQQEAVTKHNERLIRQIEGKSEWVLHPLCTPQGDLFPKQLHRKSLLLTL